MRHRLWRPISLERPHSLATAQTGPPESRHDNSRSWRDNLWRQKRVIPLQTRVRFPPTIGPSKPGKESQYSKAVLEGSAQAPTAQHKVATGDSPRNVVACWPSPPFTFAVL